MTLYVNRSTSVASFAEAWIEKYFVKIVFNKREVASFAEAWIENII